MPINQIQAFAVECDICHRSLVVAADVDPHHQFNIDIFLTPAVARAAANSSGWCLGRELVACPKCSPTTGAPPTQTPTSRDRGAGSRPGPAAGS